MWKGWWGWRWWGLQDNDELWALFFKRRRPVTSTVDSQWLWALLAVNSTAYCPTGFGVIALPCGGTKSCGQFLAWTSSRARHLDLSLCASNLPFATTSDVLTWLLWCWYLCYLPLFNWCSVSAIQPNTVYFVSLLARCRRGHHFHKLCALKW